MSQDEKIDAFKQTILASESLSDFSKKLILFLLEQSSNLTKTTLVFIEEIDQDTMHKMSSDQLTVIYYYFNCMTRALDIEASYRTAGIANDWLAIAIINPRDIIPLEKQNDATKKTKFAVINGIEIDCPEYRPEYLP